MSEQAAVEKLARRICEQSWGKGQHEALLPFAEVMVLLAEAARAVETDRVYQKLSGGKHFTSAPTEIDWKRESAQRAQKLTVEALAAFDALVKGGEK